MFETSDPAPSEAPVEVNPTQTVTPSTNDQTIPPQQEPQQQAQVQTSQAPTQDGLPAGVDWNTVTADNITLDQARLLNKDQLAKLPDEALSRLADEANKLKENPYGKQNDVTAIDWNKLNTFEKKDLPRLRDVEKLKPEEVTDADRDPNVFFDQLADAITNNVMSQVVQLLGNTTGRANLYSMPGLTDEQRELVIRAHEGMVQSGQKDVPSIETLAQTFFPNTSGATSTTQARDQVLKNQGYQQALETKRVVSSQPLAGIITADQAAQAATDENKLIQDLHDPSKVLDSATELIKSRMTNKNRRPQQR